MADRTRTPSAFAVDSSSAAATRATKPRGTVQEPRTARRSPLAVKKATSDPQRYFAPAVEAAAALRAAYAIDDPLRHGDTLRFTRIALEKLESLPVDPVAEGWDDDDIAEALFDAEALIRAAATTTTDTIIAARWAFLDRAFLLVDTAISSLPQWQGMEPSGLGERQHDQCVEAASPVEPVTYKLALAWAKEENENFAMLEAAEKMVAASCPAASALLKLVMDRMRDCVPEEDLLNRLCPEGALQ